jgi:hypothetical protein
MILCFWAREWRLYAFDILVSDGEDLRGLPLWPASHGCMARRVDGIFLSDFEQGEIAPTCSAMGGTGAQGGVHRGHGVMGHFLRSMSCCAIYRFRGDARTA